MFYQEALPKVRFLSRVDSLLTIRDRQWRKLAATFEKPTQQIHFRLCGNGCLFLYGCFDVVAVIKMGAYIFMGCLFCVGAYYPDFMVCQYLARLEWAWF